MRRHVSRLLLAGLAVALLAGGPALAQITGGPGGGGGAPSADDDAKKKQREQDFGGLTAPLPKIKNAGPCPFVKVLYDAARYVAFKDNVEAYENVGFTGEIENIVSDCAYQGDEPITVKMRARFALGRGPQAKGRAMTYRYWVAVTDRNHAVLEKAYFDMPVSFPSGVDRVTRIETLNRIVIPRKNTRVSGGNFEILMGFDVTPQMAAFNRAGKRFRPNAGQTAPGSEAGSAPKS